MTVSDNLLMSTVAAMVDTDDVSDVLAYAVEGCARAYPSEAVAILVLSRRGELELLNANSHRAEQLELVQIQTDRGPCIDVLAEGSPVIVTGAQDVAVRWGDVGEAILNAGYVGAHAYPMRWQGRTIGGLNIFVKPGIEPNPDIGQLYADLATLALVHPGKIATDDLVDRVTSAVDSRAVIEQAKGVIAYQRNLEIHEAYDVLVAEARASGSRLHEFAEGVVNNSISR